MSTRVSEHTSPEIDSDPVPTMAVVAEADDTADTDDGVYISHALLNQLVRTASYNRGVHCSSCRCTPSA